MENPTEPTPTDRSPARGLWRLAKIGLTIVLLGGLVYAIGSAHILRALAGARLSWLAAAYASFLGVRVVEAIGLKVLLSKVGVNITATRVFLANALSALYGLVLPGDLVASLAKWKSLSTATGQKATVLNAILYNRLALLLPVLALGSAALVIQDPLPATALTKTIAVVWIVIVGVILLLYHPRIGARVDARLQRLTSTAPAWLGRRAESFLAALRRFRSLRLLDHATILAISMTAYLGGLASFLFTIYALDLNVPVLTVLWTVAVLRLARQLPLTTSNLGIREGLLVLILAPYGVSAADSVAVGLIALSKQMVIAVVGLGYQVLAKDGAESARGSDPRTGEPSPLAGPPTNLERRPAA